MAETRLCACFSIYNAMKPLTSGILLSFLISNLYKETPEVMEANTSNCKVSRRGHVQR